jgi:hypothetical protein
MQRFTENTNRIDIIYSLTAILAITESMKISVSELEKSNNPKAHEYVDSMKKWIIKMNEVFLTMKSMEDELKVTNRMNFNYHMESMDLRNQITDLKKQVEKLMNQI